MVPPESDDNLCHGDAVQFFPPRLLGRPALHRLRAKDRGDAEGESIVETRLQRYAIALRAWERSRAFS